MKLLKLILEMLLLNTLEHTLKALFLILFTKEIWVTFFVK